VHRKVEEDILLERAGIAVRPGRKPWMPARVEFEKWVNWKIKLILKTVNLLHTIWNLPTCFYRMIQYELFLKK
jgi:hypothetical protein